MHGLPAGAADVPPSSSSSGSGCSSASCCCRACGNEKFCCNVGALAEVHHALAEVHLDVVVDGLVVLGLMSFMKAPTPWALCLPAVSRMENEVQPASRPANAVLPCAHRKPRPLEFGYAGVHPAEQGHHQRTSDVPPCLHKEESALQLENEVRSGAPSNYKGMWS